MEKDLVKKCEQSMIDFAKKENMSPSSMVSDFQTALLNIAGWICEYYGFSKEEYERFMREYAANVQASIDNRFKKE